MIYHVVLVAYPKFWGVQQTLALAGAFRSHRWSPLPSHGQADGSQSAQCDGAQFENQDSHQGPVGPVVEPGGKGCFSL